MCSPDCTAALPLLLDWEHASLEGALRKEVEVALHAGGAVGLVVGLRRELMALPLDVAALSMVPTVALAFLAERLRVPTDCRELGEIVAREHGNIHRSQELDAAATLRLLERGDALRRPERFEQALLACECDARGRTGLEDAPYPPRQRLGAALRAVLVALSAMALTYVAAVLLELWRPRLRDEAGAGTAADRPVAAAMAGVG